MPLYVLSDTTVTLPAGPPVFEHVQSLEKLKQIAVETQHDCFYVKIETIGTKKFGFRRGVILEYSAHVIDWQVAQWNQLTKEEQGQQQKPKFRQWLLHKRTW